MNRCRGTRAGCRRRDERGVTLVETMIVVTLTTIVMATALSTFSSFTRAVHRQSDAVDAHQELRRALDELSRTIRGSSPIRPPATARDATTSLAFDAVDGGGATRTQRIRFDARQRLVVLETLTGPSSDRVANTRFVLNDAEAPASSTFRYFTLGDRELDPSDVDGTTLIACTVRIRITLGRSGIGGGPPLDMSTDVAPRNVIPQEVRC